MDNRKAVVYCRTAYPNPISLETQRVKLTAYAEEYGFQIVTAIAEHGSGLNYSRKGLEEISRMAKSGKMDCVLIANIERLGRNTAKTVEYLCRLMEWHLDVICADGTNITQESLECWKALYEKYEAVLKPAE